MKHDNAQKSDMRCYARRGGYTLIEMAIAMVIVGLLIAPAAAVYSNWLQYQKQQTTRTNVQDLLSAIQLYRQKNGSFPCPSGLNVPRGNANYGAPVDCSYASMGAAPAVGSCSTTLPNQGICIEQSARTVFPIAPKAPATLAYQQRVIMGGIPFRALQIPEKKAYDGYGSRIVYILTLSMGDPDYVNASDGAITIKDPTQTKFLTNPPDSAVFAVLSPGPDRVGGWTAEGGEFLPCNGATGADVVNCNPGLEATGTPNTNALIVDGYASTAPGANHYDDYVAYFQSQADPLWRIIPGTQNIQDLTDKSVGIGVSAASGILDVKQASSVQGSGVTLSDGSVNQDSLLVYGTTTGGNSGAIQSDNICDANGANCFDPKIFGGDSATAMKCTTARTYMSGLDVQGYNAGGATATATNGQNGADCSTLQVLCSAPTPILNGFHVDGTPNCVGAGCGNSITTDCGNAVVLAGGPYVNGATVTLSNNNPATTGCESEKHTCTNGAWGTSFGKTNATYCSFTSSCSAAACSCTSLHNSNFTGTCTKQSCTNCGGGSTTTVTSDNCVCKSDVVTNPACPSPWTGGTYIKTVHYSGASCNSSTTNNYSTCQCTKAATTSGPVACPAGYNNGTATQNCTLNAATCTYTCTTDLTGCSCIPQGNQVTTTNCTAPATGTYTTTRVFNSTPGICAYGAPSTVYSCACPADAPGSAACTAPWTGGNYSYTMHYTLANPTCNVTNINPNYSTCQCNLPTLHNNAACSPAGGYNAGNILQTKDRDMAQPNTCAYQSSWQYAGTTCACNSQPPIVDSRSCTSPWSGTETRTNNFTNNPGVTCGYAGYGPWSGCTCDTTTPQACTVPQDCSLAAGYGPDCFTEVDGTGTYTNTYTPPSTCTAGSCNVTTPGHCDSIPFKWVLGSGTGTFFNPKVGLPTEDGGCTCGQHRNTENSVNQYCFKNDINDYQKYFCTCQ